MRIPHRKPGKFSNLTPDPMITKEKLLELERKLFRLKEKRPDMAAEVARLAELGDFSENAEYQLAKGKLRGINNAILSLENQINQARVIDPQNNGTVQIGNKVTVEINNARKQFLILGSVETDPKRGIISQHSPIGSALIGHGVGEIVEVELENKKVVYYKIIDIL